MSEAGDWDPGPWKGHDFKSAKKKYDIHVGRSYDDAVKKSVNPDKLVPPELNTESQAPLVVACDVTGSMGESPATIFSKCPYLDLEGKEYLGDDMAISFAAIGDAYSDNYPLQVRPFAKGLELKERLEELIIEGGGGGQSMETYELAALYYATHVKMPNALNPIFVFIGDEGLYEFVDKAQAKRWTRTTLEKRMSYAEVLRALQQKYAVYCIRQPYNRTGTDKMSAADKKIHKQWADVLGEDHMAFLPDATRIVDVIFGILAKETGRVKYFTEEITQRQKPDQVKTAMKGLKTILGLPAPSSKRKSTSGKSVTTKQKSTTKTSNLLTKKGSKKSSTTLKKLTAGTKKSTTGAKKSITGTKKSTTGAKKSITGTKKSTTGSKKSITGSNKSTTGNKKSTTGSKKSTTGTKKSTTGSKKSTTGTKKSTTGTKKSTTGTTSSKKKKISGKSVTTGKKSSSKNSKKLM